MLSFKTKRTIAVCLLVAFFVLVILWIYDVLQIDLMLEARQNEKYLNSLVILSDQETKASARPNGDILTGSSSPARTTFMVSGTLGDVYDEVTKNLIKQGYTISDEFDSLGGSSNSEISRIDIKARNGDKLIVLRFVLEEKIECEKVPGVGIVEPCYFKRPVTIQTSGLYEKDLKELVVLYDDVNNDPSYLVTR